VGEWGCGYLGFSIRNVSEVTGASHRSGIHDRDIKPWRALLTLRVCPTEVEVDISTLLSVSRMRLHAAGVHLTDVALWWMGSLSAVLSLNLSQHPYHAPLASVPSLALLPGS
jgi:hypothetical protein